VDGSTGSGGCLHIFSKGWLNKNRQPIRWNVGSSVSPIRMHRDAVAQVASTLQRMQESPLENSENFYFEATKTHVGCHGRVQIIHTYIYIDVLCVWCIINYDTIYDTCIWYVYDMYMICTWLFTNICHRKKRPMNVYIYTHTYHLSFHGFLWLWY